jgi:hypothetical protein
MKLKEQGYFEHYSFVLDGQAIGFRFQEGKSLFPFTANEPWDPTQRPIH